MKALLLIPLLLTNCSTTPTDECAVIREEIKERKRARYSDSPRDFGWFIKGVYIDELTMSWLDCQGEINAD